MEEGFELKSGLWAPNVKMRNLNNNLKKGLNKFDLAFIETQEILEVMLKGVHKHILESEMMKYVPDEVSNIVIQETNSYLHNYFIPFETEDFIGNKFGENINSEPSRIKIDTWGRNKVNILNEGSKDTTKNSESIKNLSYNSSLSKVSKKIFPSPFQDSEKLSSGIFSKRESPIPPIEEENSQLITPEPVNIQEAILYNQDYKQSKNLF